MSPVVAEVTPFTPGLTGPVVCGIGLLLYIILLNIRTGKLTPLLPPEPDAALIVGLAVLVARIPNPRATTPNAPPPT